MVTRPVVTSLASVYFTRELREELSVSVSHCVRVRVRVRDSVRVRVRV